LRNKESNTEERERIKGIKIYYNFYNCATVAQLQKNLQFSDFTSSATGFFLCLNAKFPLHFPFTIANENALRAFTMGNCILSCITISKNYFINYTIPFYNPPNIPIFIFLFYLLK